MDDWKTNPSRRYQQMCVDYGKLHGHGTKDWPILRRADMPGNWQAWKDYYRHRRLWASLALMNERPEKTVPAFSPYDFDPEYGQPGLPLDARRYGGLD